MNCWGFLFGYLELKGQLVKCFKSPELCQFSQSCSSQGYSLKCLVSDHVSLSSANFKWSYERVFLCGSTFHRICFRGGGSILNFYLFWLFSGIHKISHLRCSVSKLTVWTTSYSQSNFYWLYTLWTPHFNFHVCEFLFSGIF